jgi:DNA-binding NarL/FixJ family response regulator
MSSDSSPIRILVVDDHQLTRLGIATLLLPESDMTTLRHDGENCLICGVRARVPEHVGDAARGANSKPFPVRAL